MYQSSWCLSLSDLQCLALSTSTIMFMLSRDRLNMDLDQESLELMLRLNEADAADRSCLSAAKLRDLEKTKQRVQELLAELQQELHAREIDLGFVSVLRFCFRVFTCNFLYLEDYNQISVRSQRKLVFRTFVSYRVSSLYPLMCFEWCIFLAVLKDENYDFTSAVYF